MDIKNSLGTKIGPLPTAAWAGIAVVIILIVYSRRKKNTPSVTDLGSPDGYFPRTKNPAMGAETGVTPGSGNQQAYANYGQGIYDTQPADNSMVAADAVSTAAYVPAASTFSQPGDIPTGGPSPSAVVNTNGDVVGYTKPVDAKPAYVDPNAGFSVPVTYDPTPQETAIIQAALPGLADIPAGFFSFGP